MTNTLGLLSCPQVMPPKSTSMPPLPPPTRMTQRAPQTVRAALPQTWCARSPPAFWTASAALSTRCLYFAERTRFFGLAETSGFNGVFVSVCPTASAHRAPRAWFRVGSLSHSRWQRGGTPALWQRRRRRRRRRRRHSVRGSISRFPQRGAARAPAHSSSSHHKAWPHRRESCARR